MAEKTYFGLRCEVFGGLGVSQSIQVNRQYAVALRRRQRYNLPHIRRQDSNLSPCPNSRENYSSNEIKVLNAA